MIYKERLSERYFPFFPEKPGDYRTNERKKTERNKLTK